VRRVLPILCGLILVAVAVAQSNPATDGEQTPGEAPSIKGVLEGPRNAVFDTAKDSCEVTDIPDAPARAFRDYQGTVHLVAASSTLRQSLGPTLNSVIHSCDVGRYSTHDPNPADYNDNTWLDSFYSMDGTDVVALGHMEYHGWEHAGECHTQNLAACWYNADTFNLSEDGGYHFHSFKAPANYVVGLPFQYVIDAGPEGYSVDTNIVKAGEWYYAMVTDWPWPPDCGPYGTVVCLVPYGASPIRTSNILDVTSWRGWNGTDFSLSFVDPYLGPVADPETHVYTPVANMYYVNAINIYKTSNLFIATQWDYCCGTYGSKGLYLSTSTDMVNWSQPTLIVSLADLLAKEPPGNWSYGYFSLLDPSSTDANFSMIGDHPSVYYVRFDNDHPPYVRVLFRQGIELTVKQ
jgi:hypothetical protein